MGSLSVTLDVKDKKWSDKLSEANKGLKSFLNEVQGGLKALSSPLKTPVAFMDVFALGTKAAGDFTSAVRTGAAPLEELGKVAEGLPIAGPFLQGVKASVELVTGAKAAKEELKSLNQHLDYMRDVLADIQARANLRGKFGDQQESAEIENSFNKQNLDLDKRIKEKKGELKELESHNNLSFGYTDAQKTHMQQVSDEIKVLKKQRESLGDDKDDALTRHQKESDERQRQYINARDEDFFQIAAKNEARTLKLHGDTLGARKVMIREDSEAKQRAIVETVTPEALKGLSPEDREERLKKASQVIASLQKDEANSLRGADVEEVRRKEELVKDNEEKILEIRAQGRIENFKAQDEATNHEHEKHGDATRSHLAEQAQLQEEYRKEVAEIEKKFRDPNGGMDANLHQKELSAAAEKHQQQVDALASKSHTEQVKNTEELAASRRQAWAEHGDNAESYKAKLQEINEEAKKFNDPALQKRMINDLNVKTFEELKKQNPDHEPNVNLFGRRLSHTFVGKGNHSNEIARETLKNIQDQAKRDQGRDDIFQYMRQWFQNAVSSGSQVLQEIGIGSLSGG